MSAAEFNELLLSNADPLRPFAVSLTHDQEVAKDLFQETLYKALANQDKYSTGTNIKAWLFTIMRNIFINDYRRRTKQRTIFDRGTIDILINSGKMIVSNGGENCLQLKEIHTAIYQLPQIFKIPFLLHFEGYRYYEISESLNEPLGTIKSRIHFARKLLKQQLSRY
ncbi:MAG TPA: RNA polymerase sigma factor [Chitinophagaceae bacterium]|nr:RNA polymerase sigma factor [Chitinophagaceae bacterium]